MLGRSTLDWVPGGWSATLTLGLLQGCPSGVKPLPDRTARLEKIKLAGHARDRSGLPATRAIDKRRWQWWSSLLRRVRILPDRASSRYREAVRVIWLEPVQRPRRKECLLPLAAGLGK